MKSRILLICGNNPRNLFLYKCISSEYEISGIIIQNRSDLNPSPMESISNRDKGNFIKHFSNRDKIESHFFDKSLSFDDVETIEVDANNISSLYVLDFVKKIKPDIVFTCGVAMIKDPLFSALPKTTINLHSGITPRYKGSAGNFWPFYFLEPNWAGATFHILSPQLDMGGIVHQTVPNLEYGDSIHQVACKAITLACHDSLKIIDKYNSKGFITSVEKQFTGKLFLEKEFRAEHLRVVYELFNDNIVDHFLDSDIQPNPPKLVEM
jgi:methionyl-tRNA formyltransferase